MVVVGTISPILGAAADYSGRKKRFLIVATLCSVAATAGLATVGPGDLLQAIVLFVIAFAGFEAGYVFYNAFLHEIAEPGRLSQVSGWAWGIGFIGGLSALVLCRPWLASQLTVDGTIVPTAVADRQVVFLIVAVFFLLFSVPAFLWLREGPPQGQRIAPGRYVGVGIHRVRRTLRELRRFRETGKFVLAALFFNDGISTVIAFSAIYARQTFGFSDGDLVTLFLVLNVVAFPTTVAAGYLADRVGARRTLLVSLVLWIAVVITGALAVSRAQFWIMASGAAIGMGSTQAIARSYMAQITPAERESEFFGFYVLSGKVASIMGLLMVGALSNFAGSQRLGIASLALLFLLGLLLLARVDDARARAAARSGIPDPAA